MVNNIANGKQMKIIWHVDDLKISNVYEKELILVIKCMKSMHCEDMRVLQGNKHD